MIRDVINNLKIDQVIETAVQTSDTDGSSVDMQGYTYCTFIALIGESGDTLSGSVKIELEVEESDDDSTFTDVADSELQNYVDGTNDGCFGVIDGAADDQKAYFCTYRGNARYVRPVLNFTGTHSNGTPIGVVAIRHGAEELPVSN
ncbi:MAG: hypothetical protein JRH08_00680 [Deltaproteobacteria bacterium]|nr:hypothetical protein [Deltaproteobacteria bacterium]MBW2124218.1 hypothetical protein [Deltaproteobacteria bacterium]